MKQAHDCFGKMFVDSRKDIAAEEVANYTAECKDDSHFLVINKKDLAKIKANIFQKELQKDIKFMKEIAQLSKLTKRVLIKIRNAMTLQKVLRNQTLFREGDPAR